MTRILLPLAVACGLAIAWVDSRPTWDDTGVTAGALVLTAGLFGLLAGRRPWLVALCVGAWLPLFENARASVALAVLAFAFAGAYAGYAVRRLGAGMTRTT